MTRILISLTLATSLCALNAQAQTSPVYSNVRTNAAAAPRGLYVEQVQGEGRSRVGALTLERIVDFEARVLCYRVQQQASVSCIPFSQLDPTFLSELYQRAAGAR